MDLPIFGLKIPGLLFWVAILYACFATGVMQLIGHPLSGCSRHRQSKQLPLRSRARTRIQRADCSTQGRGTGDRSGGACVRRRVHHCPADHLGADPAQHLPSVLRPDLRHHPLCRHRAFFYFLAKVDFGRFNQSADAFSNVNSAMNFFVDRYTGLAAFKATVERLTSFDDAFDRAKAAEARTPRITTTASTGGLCRCQMSRSPCLMAASSPELPISCSFRKSRRWLSALRGWASRPSSAPSPAFGRSAQATSNSRPTPS